VKDLDQQPTPLARSVLSAQVKDKLLTWILEGELPPGSRVIGVGTSWS